MSLLEKKSWRGFEEGMGEEVRRPLFYSLSIMGGSRANMQTNLVDNLRLQAKDESFITSILLHFLMIDVK